MTSQDDTIATQDFRMFLFLPSIFIKSNCQSVEERVKLVLENASIYLTNSTNNIAEQYGMKILGLRPYWPYLVSVDFIFGIVKRHIRSSEKCKNIDFS